MEYILNGAIVGAGNSLQINGTGITGYDLDDGYAFTLDDTVQVYHQKVEVTSAEILALNATPITLVAAPGAGKVIVPIAIYGRMTFVTAPYDTNLDLSVISVGANSYIADNSTLLPLAAGTAIEFFQPVTLATGDNQMVANAALQLTVATADPLTGAGTLEMYVDYKIITL